jgi:acyl-CoA oxidase
MELEGVDHLAFERNKAEFDVDAMKIVWAGSSHAFEVSDRMSRLVASDPVNCLFNFVPSIHFFSYSSV